MCRNFGTRAGTAVLGVLFTTALVAAGEHDPQKITKALDSHKLTLAKAIETAQASTKGRAIEARAWMKGNDLMVRVNCWADDKCMEVPIDAKTGKAGKAAAMKDDKAHSNGRELIRLMDSGNTALLKAIAAAEAESKGQALEARSLSNKNALTYTIRCATSEKCFDVTVDGKTGKVTKSREIPADESAHANAPSQHMPKKDTPRKP